MKAELYFPDVADADEDGLLAIGGDLSEERLLLAYQSGIFPWYSAGEPILWWSPNPRMVLFPQQLKISKSMKKLLREQAFVVTINKNFEAVIEHCSKIYRPGQDGTWITPEIKEAYIGLHKKGLATSVEVWSGEDLVGGLYGVNMNKVFYGESMFSLVRNASKYGFIKWVQRLQLENYKVIDCQVYTPHLESLGAQLIAREDFVKLLIE